MRTLVLALLLTATVLAGCADQAKDDGATEVTPGTQFESDVVQVAVPVMPREPPAAGERNLTAAPEWRLGEWWSYEMEDGFTGGSYKFTRVVGGQDVVNGNYLVGFPVDQFSNDVMLFHIPGFGDIRQHDLAYETHDHYFTPLAFPMSEGKTWDVSFEGQANGTAGITKVDGNKVHIEMDVNVYGTIVADYDADVGEVTEMTIGQDGSYAHYKVVDHGYGYKGTIRVPHAHDLIFNNGRFVGALDVGRHPTVPTPVFGASGPTETVTIEPGYDRASFIIAVGGGAFTGLPATVGVFRETVTAPDNTVYEATWTPADAAAGHDVTIVAVGHDDPEGTWTLQHAAGGVGIAFVEGIGYHSIDIELPSGCVVASANAMHHSGLCKVQGNSTA